MSAEVNTPPSPMADIDRPSGSPALVTALRRMWGGTGPALVAIVLNAVAQSLLIYWNAGVGMNAPFIVSLVVSAGVLIFTFALLSRTAVAAIDGRVSTRRAMAETRRIVPMFAVWVIGLVVAVTAAIMVNPILGWLIAVVAAFVPIAAADGRANAIGANFRVIRERPVRWLITAILVTLIGAVIYLLSVVNVLFVKGFPASFIAWMAYGFLAWWLLTAWAEIYRSTKVGNESPLQPQFN